MQEKLHMSQHPGINPPPFNTEIIEIEGNNIFLQNTFCYPKGGGCLLYTSDAADE